jgi:hypothetical protein
MNQIKKIKFPIEAEHLLIQTAKRRKVYLEGSIIKIIEAEPESDFEDYLNEAKRRDRETRMKRLDVIKQAQEDTKQLKIKASENEALMEEVKQALEAAEQAKETALSDLDVMQQKTQFELIGTTVKVSLVIIVAVGIMVTAMYGFSLYIDSEEKDLIGNTWSNLLGILLTNSFSIIGTIMGVKYASNSQQKRNDLRGDERDFMH